MVVFYGATNLKTCNDFNCVCFFSRVFTIVSDVDLNHQSPQSGANSPSATLNNSHKQNSLRNTKLARRARSFKDDFIGKLWVRAPNINTLPLGR